MPRPAPSPVAQVATEATAQSTRVLRQFRLVFGAVRQHFHQIEKQAGIGGAMAAALGYIQAQPGMRVSELAVAMDVHQSTASNLIKQLVQRGLITAGKGEDDRRSVRLLLQPAGQAVLDKVIGPREGVLPHALSGLPDEALSQLEHGLHALLKQLPVDQKAPTARTPPADL